jgi:hypothetical protein
MSDGRMTMKPQVGEFSPFDVFLSYLLKDKAGANAVVSAHEKAGFAAGTPHETSRWVHIGLLNEKIP